MALGPEILTKGQAPVVDTLRPSQRCPLERSPTVLIDFWKTKKILLARGISSWVCCATAKSCIVDQTLWILEFFLIFMFSEFLILQFAG